MKDQITITGHDGAFAAYIARPKTVPAPASIVLGSQLQKGCSEIVSFRIGGPSRVMYGQQCAAS
jgi:hypothetical protein